MLLSPRGPSAGPIGAEGFAAPAGTCNFRKPVTFFAISHSCCAGTNRRFQVRGSDQKRLATALSSPGLFWREGLRRNAHRSDLLDLTEFQLDGRGAAED